MVFDINIFIKFAICFRTEQMASGQEENSPSTTAKPVVALYQHTSTDPSLRLLHNIKPLSLSDN